MIASLMRPPISIHALREEGDSTSASHEGSGVNFYPRPPRGGRRYMSPDYKTLGVFLSTPSARRATGYSTILLRKHCISIHALREEGDTPELDNACSYVLFLSTPSARRATCRG